MLKKYSNLPPGLALSKIPENDNEDRDSILKKLSNRGGNK